MPDYRRNRVPGGTYFFTVNLLDRNSRLLTDRIDELREAVRDARARAPFHIDAWTVLPEHMHCVWTLPSGDDKHRFVTEPSAWPYSSFQRAVAAGLYPPNWARRECLDAE